MDEHLCIKACDGDLQRPSGGARALSGCCVLRVPCTGALSVFPLFHSAPPMRSNFWGIPLKSLPLTGAGLCSWWDLSCGFGERARITHGDGQRAGPCVAMRRSRCRLLQLLIKARLRLLPKHINHLVRFMADVGVSHFRIRLKLLPDFLTSPNSDDTFSD